MVCRQHVVLFARAPRIGRVKTRLAVEIGAVPAWQAYRRMLRTLLGRLHRPARWRKWLAVTPDSQIASLRSRPTGWICLPQGRGDLGQRLQRVILNLPPGPIVIIGSDVPAIGPEHITRAFRALERVDMVFGPAMDGGFWLLGVRSRRFVRSLFSDVRWSSRFALTDTMANLGQAKVAFVDLLEDVDTAAALERWRRSLQPARAAVPAGRAPLSSRPIRKPSRRRASR